MKFDDLKRQGRFIWLLTLLLLAGFVNAATLLHYRQTLSHMSGNLTKLGFGVAGTGQQAWLLLLILACFLLGAALSGMAFPQHSARQWKRCGKVLLGGGTLMLFALLMIASEAFQIALVSLVMGAQNGLAVRHRGILTRTTHITGHLTDCGAALGRMLTAGSEWRAEAVYFKYHMACVLSYLLGVVLAALLNLPVQTVLGTNLMVLAGFLYAATGVLTYLIGWREQKQMRA